MPRKTRENVTGGVRISRAPVVEGKVGLSIPTIHRKVREGTFPAPVKLSNQAVGWLDHEIDEWLAARIAERDSAP